MATPTKTANKRVTPKKSTPDTPEVTEVTISREGSLSFEALDNITATSGWSTGQMINKDGSLTGKGIAGSIWLSTRKSRPDITPADIYSATDYKALGIELVAEEATENPTDAAS